MVNYFRYLANAPRGDEPFGTTVSFDACPWNSESVLLYLTLQAEVPVEAPANNLVFLIDVSGSMASANKLPLLQKAFSYLVDSLGEEDTVSIVTYSGKESVVLSGCPASDKTRILNAISSLKASGSTNGQAGLQRAYEVARNYYIEGGNNRIIMASDGDLNVGISSVEELKNYISTKREEGIFLSVLGFGSGNYQDEKMETIANHGNGAYYYIDSEREAERVLTGDLTAMLHTVAKDVKLQITFSSDFVSAYRLIGYENRVLNNEDFTDDTKDAGEVGAGHQVTVCYELLLREGTPTAEDVMATLSVRYKAPDADVSEEKTYSLAYGMNQHTKEDCALINSLIMLSMILREDKLLTGAPHISLSYLVECFEENIGQKTDAEKDDFYALLVLLMGQSDIVIPE
jgi:Ca-activated chloride channel family protein